MNKTQVGGGGGGGGGSSSDLIDAKLEEHQLCGSKHCPGCGHKLQAKPVHISYLLHSATIYTDSNKIILIF